jgi:hypothetical protein
MALDKLNPRDEPTKGAFGEASTSEATPIVQLNFNYNINEEITQLSNNGGTATVINNMLNLSTGAAANQSAQMNSIASIKYSSGQGVFFRSSGVFTAGAVGSSQLLGAGDSSDGVFFGYIDNVFGVVHRHDGLAEVRYFQITTASTTVESVTVTLNGDTILVPVTASGNITTTANELGAADYSGVGRGWHVHIEGDLVEFFSFDSAVKSGVFSLTATTAVASITQEVIGKAPTNDFIPQTSWSEDNADNTAILPVIDWTKGNVFQVKYQWLGFGLIQFLVENPDTGEDIIVHKIKYAGNNTTPSLANPHLQLCAAVENTTNDTDIVLSVGSISGFTEGRIAGVHFHNGVEGSKTIGTTEVPVLTIHNELIYAAKINKIRIKLIFASLVTDGNKNVFFRFRINPTLTDANFINVEEDLSIVAFDTAATAVTGGDSQLTVGLAKVASDIIDIAAGTFFLTPGQFLTVTAQAATAGSSDVTVSLNWEELF